MKQSYTGISVYASEALEKASIEQLKQIDKALVAAAYAMRDKARKLFVSNAKGYNLQSLQDGVMLGRLRHGNDGVTSVTLHAFGNNTNKNSYKARFFVGGAYHRQTRSQRYRGSIEALNTIENALDQGTLDDYINNVIK